MTRKIIKICLQEKTTQIDLILKTERIIFFIKGKTRWSSLSHK